MCLQTAQLTTECGLLSRWVSAQWLEMQTVVYRTQGILPLPPKVETQLVSSSEAGLTGLRSDSSAQHEQQVQISSSPSWLVPHFCLIPCQERGLPLFFLLMCSFIHRPANHSDLLITFGELEQAASRLCLTRATAHTEPVPNINLCNLYSSWNWRRIS